MSTMNIVMAACVGALALVAVAVFALRRGKDKKPEPPALPKNPALAQDGFKQKWSFQPKDYDNSYRIRWPSHFAATCGAASHCTVNGHRAEFRRYDTDGGAMRPSYTLPMSTPLSTPVLCILMIGTRRLAWFETPDTAARHGVLPQ